LSLAVQGVGNVPLLGGRARGVPITHSQLQGRSIGNKSVFVLYESGTCCVSGGGRWWARLNAVSSSHNIGISFRKHVIMQYKTATTTFSASFARYNIRVNYDWVLYY